MSPEPSAPPLLDFSKNDVVEYNCEDGCDLEFIVGTENDNLMRFPVHSRRLVESPYFKALLSDSFDNSQGQRMPGTLRQFRIDDLDGKVFDNLMRFIYDKPLNLQIPETTIETLKAAHRYLLHDLVRICVKQLNTDISQNNVLYIFAHVGGLCNDMEGLEELTNSDNLSRPMPKRRKLSADDQKENDHLLAGLEMKRLCGWLFCQCLAFIDVNATHVLESRDIEDLSDHEIHFLLKRDSLNASEVSVFSALIRWAVTQCKRQHLPLTSESKRWVLRDLVYLIRIFQMKAIDFLAGPAESGLLSDEEVELIKNIMLRGRSFQSQRRQFRLDEFPKIRDNWCYMCTSRSFKEINEDKHGAGKSRRNTLAGHTEKSLKMKGVGGIVKHFWWPCVSNNDRGGRKRKNTLKSDQSSQAEVKKKGKASSGEGLQRRESTLSKVVDITLRTLAFFFD